MSPTVFLASFMLLVCIFCTTSNGQDVESNISKKFKLSFGAEYQKENFQWSIAGTPQGTNPNILSELIFNPIRATGFNISGSFQPFRRLAVVAEYKRLFTFQGSAEDNDYNGDNRTSPLNLQSFRSDKGKTMYISSTILYSIIQKPNFKINVGAGYVYRKELFYLLSNDFITLNTKYQPTWNGPLFSANPEWNINNKLSTAFKVNFHLLNYYAEADWNEIKEFQHPKSFTHNAHGFGLDYKLQTTYKVNSTLSLAIDGYHANWWTNHGVDTLYLITGDVTETRFNNAKKKNIGFSISGILLF